MAAPQVDILIQATTSGFKEVIDKLNDLKTALSGVNQSPAVMSVQNLSKEMGALNASVSSLTGKVGSLASSLKGLETAAQSGNRQLLTMRMTMQSYINDVKAMILIQARWYGARAVLFAAVGIPVSVIKSIAEYAVELDTARSAILRFFATQGQLTQQMIANSEAIVLAMRRSLVQVPTTFEKLNESVQAFVGAGVDPKTIMDMTTYLAQLKNAFSEIDMQQFAVALTGAWNQFGSSIKAAGSEAEKFKVIIETLLRAQAVGVIRPEEFTKVLQYMGPISSMAGFTLQQMTAIAVVVTDMGRRAQSAARLSAGFMNSLVSEKARNNLERIGIQLDKSKTLAAQFDTIAQQLIKRIGTGEVSMGSLQFISGLTSSDRLGVFISFLQNYEKYVSLTKDLEGSAGGLQASSDAMSMSLAKKWQLMINNFKEAGQSIADDTGGMVNKVLFGLLELSKGFLVAMDSEGKFANAIGALGPISATVAVALITVKTLAEGIYAAFVAAGVAINETVRLIFWALERLAAGAKLTSLSEWFRAAKENSAGAGEIGIKELGDLSDRWLHPEKGIFSEIKVSPTPPKIGGKRTPGEGVPDKPVKEKTYGVQNLGSMRSFYSSLIEEVKISEEKQLRLLDISYKKGLVSLQDYDDQKDKIISDGSEDRRTLLMLEASEIEKQYVKITAAINADPKLTGASKTNKLEAALKSYTAAVEDNKKKLEALGKDEEIKSADRDLRIYESHKRIILLQANNDARVAMETAHTEAEIEKSKLSEYEKDARVLYDYRKISALGYYNLLKDNAQKEIDLELDVAKKKVEIAEAALAVKQAKLKEQGGSLTDEELKAANSEINKLKEELALTKRRLEEKSITVGKDIERQAQEDPLYVYESARARKIAEREKARSADYLENGLEPPEATNWELFLDQISGGMAGFGAQTTKTLDKISADWTDTGKNIAKGWESVVNSLADTFQSVFVDNMNGELKSLKDYFESFTKAVLTMLFKIAAQELALMAIEKTKAAISTIGTVASVASMVVHEGGIVGKTSIPSRSASPSTFVGARRFHTGLAPDEFPAILQKGEAVIPRNKVTKSIIDYILNRKSITDDEDETKEKETIKSSLVQKTIDSITNIVSKRLEIGNFKKIVEKDKSISSSIKSFAEKSIDAKRFHTGLAPDLPVTSIRKTEKDKTATTTVEDIIKKNILHSRIEENIYNSITTGSDFKNLVSEYRSSISERKSAVLQNITESITSRVNESEEFTKGSLLNHISNERDIEAIKSDVAKSIINNITNSIVSDKEFTKINTSDSAYTERKISSRDLLSKAVNTITGKLTSSYDFSKTIDKYRSYKEDNITTNKDVLDIISSSANRIDTSKLAETNRNIEKFSATKESEIAKTTILQKAVEIASRIATKNIELSKTAEESIESKKIGIVEKYPAGNLLKTPVKEIVSKFSDGHETKDNSYTSTVSAIVDRFSEKISSASKDSSIYSSKDEKTKEIDQRKIYSVSKTDTFSNFITTAFNKLIDRYSSKERVSYLSDKIVDKENTASNDSITNISSYSRTSEIFNDVLHKLTDRFSSILEKRTSERLYDKEKIYSSTIDKNINTISDLSRKDTEKSFSIYDHEEKSASKDNITYLSDILKEKETSKEKESLVTSLSSAINTVIHKITDKLYSNFASEKLESSESESSRSSIKSLSDSVKEKYIDRVSSSLVSNKEQTRVTDGITKIFKSSANRIESIASLASSYIGPIGVIGSPISVQAKGGDGGEDGAGAAAVASGSSNVISFHKGGIVPYGSKFTPVFHSGGLNSDEREAILQTGERVLSREQTVMMDNMYNRVMTINNDGSSKPTNVEVNVINQSSQNVSAEQKGVKFDMEKTIVTVVLKDLNNNGHLYSAIKGVR